LNEEGEKVKYCWPRDLLPELRQNIRVLSYGYDADVSKFIGVAGSTTLDDHAEAFLHQLESVRDTNEVARDPTTTPKLFIPFQHHNLYSSIAPAALNFFRPFSGGLVIERVCTHLPEHLGEFSQFILP
jgi:hypothetical protein